MCSIRRELASDNNVGRELRSGTTAWALEAEDPRLNHSFATGVMITLGKLLKPFMPPCSPLLSAVTAASSTQGCCEEAMR